MKIEKDKFNSLSEKDQNLQLLRVSGGSVMKMFTILIGSFNYLFQHEDCWH